LSLTQTARYATGIYHPYIKFVKHLSLISVREESQRAANYDRTFFVAFIDQIVEFPINLTPFAWQQPTFICTVGDTQA
jgi:hypothetical protein